MATREIPLEDIIHCPFLFYREDLGNLDEITGDIFTDPIVRLSKTHPGKFELIAGERRCKKAEKDGKETIKCAVFEMTDEDAIRVHAKENLQRKPLNLIEEGKQYKNMLETLKITQKQLAKEFGKSQSTVSNTMRLLNLPGIVQNYLSLNKLTLSHGLLLLQVTDENSQIELADMCIVNKYSTSQLKKKMMELEETQANLHHHGQTKFIDKGRRWVLPPPETIEPRPIEIIRADPECPEICEKLLEIRKVYVLKAGDKCSDCPLEKVCVTVLKHEKLFDPSYRNQRSLSSEEFSKISEKEKKGSASSEVGTEKEGKSQEIKQEDDKSES